MIIGLNCCLFGMLGWALFRGIKRASKERGNRCEMVSLFHQLVSIFWFEFLNQLSLNPSNVTPLFFDIHACKNDTSSSSSSVTGGKFGKLEIGGDSDFPESFSISITQFSKISIADVTIISSFSSLSWHEAIDPSRFRGLRMDSLLIHLKAAEEDEVLMYWSIVEMIVSRVIFYRDFWWSVKRIFLNGF